MRKICERQNLRAQCATDVKHLDFGVIIPHSINFEQHLIIYDFFCILVIIILNMSILQITLYCSALWQTQRKDIL